MAAAVAAAVAVAEESAPPADTNGAGPSSAGGGRGARKRDEDPDYDDEEEEDDDDPYGLGLAEDDDDDYDDDDAGTKKRQRLSSRAATGGTKLGPPYIEVPLNTAALRGMLPISEASTSNFACPPGWEEEAIEGGRRVKKRWVRRDDTGRVVQSFDRRGELEEMLERAADVGGATHVGQVVGGRWEVGPRHVETALRAVLDELARAGLVRKIEPQDSGKMTEMYVVANRYQRGEAFDEYTAEGRKKRAKREAAPKEEEEELSEFELQRRKNMQRNHELLMAMGLA